MGFHLARTGYLAFEHEMTILGPTLSSCPCAVFYLVHWHGRDGGYAPPRNVRTRREGNGLGTRRAAWLRNAFRQSEDFHLVSKTSCVARSVLF